MIRSYRRSLVQIPQGLKPAALSSFFSTTKVVPFQIIHRSNFYSVEENVQCDSHQQHCDSQSFWALPPDVVGFGRLGG
jgi:hypothetical protein